MSLDIRDLYQGVDVQGVGDASTSPAPDSIAYSTALCSSSLNDIRSDIQTMHQLGVTPEYYAKQMHRIPQAPVVDRVSYIVERCRGKRVLHLGCSSGALHGMLAKVAASLEGWDIEYPPETHGTFKHVDLDSLEDLHDAGLVIHPELIVIAEVLEHLGNPGQLLQAMRGHKCPLLITVPNAFSAIARRQVQGGLENVHWQHTSWYSWHTLLTLVQRYGYVVQDVAWYNCPRGAQPQESEGLIFLTA